VTIDTATVAVTRPAARIAPRDIPFWDGCARGELHVQLCAGCGLHFFPSQDRCPACQSTTLSWTPVGLTGALYTYTVIHQAGTEGRPRGFETGYPYAVGVVEIDGAQGARIAGNLVGMPLDDIAIGMRLRAVFEPGEARLPDFVLDEDA
jgi:uncharacterized OB-fold protein